MSQLSVWYCVYILLVTSAIAGTENLSLNTAQMQEWDDPLLLVSTLDGSFYGVGQKTGYIRWKLEDEPVVKVPVESSNSIMPFFLPDPRDGSLYMLRGGEHEVLKKLPFTIPQLVASSPCKSSDGILYTGKKSDTWFAVDPKTGFREEILSFNNVQKMCPLSDSGSVLVGRAEYNILMYDSKIKERKWNVTFYDYSSNTMDSQQLNNYGLVHFTASSTGHAVTLDRHLGSLLWENDFQSPVIAMYVIENDGLISVPLTSVAKETLQHLQSRLTLQHTTTAFDLQLHPTLYVGEHVHGLYALLSLVDDYTPTMAPGKARGMLLLEGPAPVVVSGSQWTYNFPVPGHNLRVSPQNLELPLTFRSLPRQQDCKQSSVVILGHYSLPELSKATMTPQITGRSDPIIQSGDHTWNGSVRQSKLTERHSVGVQTDESQEQNQVVDGWKMLQEVNFTFIMSRDFFKFSYRETKMWINQQENKGLKIMLIILFGCICSMFWYLRMQVREFQNFSQSSRGSSAGSLHHDVTAIIEDIGSGKMRVGKITFDMEQVLGKGCEGTFVYKGQFESRAVAVKRLLPECFTFADREVNLLRESDEHANVVRYFCTEQDKQFRYIALELCAATLQDYVEGTFDAGGRISPRVILYQATAGLQHLHSLDIVHRDIKPHNVLISMPNAAGEVRAMISDFGLCKKLKVGRMSFSRRSGVTGTDGWIAPEMMVGNTRTTCAVDIFSLGCVIYYVMSWGKHPFGDALRRQANILSGESRLSDLEGADSLLCCHLVGMMIQRDPAERPPTLAVLKHPLFWGKKSVLTFLQDVSDRIERDKEDSPVLQSLEDNGSFVVRDDWRHCIDTQVAQDLRKYRNYSGSSVRDLLRALRNKKHHYHELSVEAQRSLGEIPGKFVEYWTNRFPLLVLHSWLAMQCVKVEPIFSHYYHEEYIFQGTAPELMVSCMKSDTVAGDSAGTWLQRSSPGLKQRRGSQDSPRTRRKLPDAGAPAEELSWRWVDDPVRKQYLTSSPKWFSRRVSELKQEHSRAHARSSSVDRLLCASQDAVVAHGDDVSQQDEISVKLSSKDNRTKPVKKKNHRKKSPDVPLAWKLQADDT